MPATRRRMVMTRDLPSGETSAPGSMAGGGVPPGRRREVRMDSHSEGEQGAEETRWAVMSLWRTVGGGGVSWWASF